MSATVRLGDGSALVMDPIMGTAGRIASGVLLTLEGRTHGEVLNCALIPLDKIGAIIESLRLTASQVGRDAHPS